MSTPLSPRDLLTRRLAAQHLIGRPFRTAREAVETLGAVQAQDFGGAKWALAQRLDGATDAGLEAALARGELLRTHVLRPTWHLVAPADLRWLRELTARRVHLANGHQYRTLGLGPSERRRCQKALQGALAGGKTLTRTEAATVMRDAGVSLPTPLHVIVALMAAELEAVICSGPMRGRQHTYALLDERVGHAGPRWRGDEALAQLALRYFTGHGPATVADFSWWSGLTVADAKRAVSLAAGGLASGTLRGAPCWWGAKAPRISGATGAWLLPNYDEYLVAYADRTAVLGAPARTSAAPRSNLLFTNTVIVDGTLAGTWRRTVRRHAVSVEVMPLRPLAPTEKRQVEEQAARYADFLGLTAQTQWSAPVG